MTAGAPLGRALAMAANRVGGRADDRVERDGAATAAEVGSDAEGEKQGADSGEGPEGEDIVPAVAERQRNDLDQQGAQQRREQRSQRPAALSVAGREGERGDQQAETDRREALVVQGSRESVAQRCAEAQRGENPKAGCAHHEGKRTPAIRPRENCGADVVTAPGSARAGARWFPVRLPRRIAVLPPCARPGPTAPGVSALSGVGGEETERTALEWDDGSEVSLIEGGDGACRPLCGEHDDRGIG